MGRPLKIAKAQAVATLTATNGTTEVVTTNANFTDLGIIAGMPFVPASNVGNLVAGTTYWILEVINAGPNSTFTVSSTPLNANPTYTKFNLGTTAAQSVALTIGLVDYGFSNPNGSNTATNSTSYGVVGGNTSFYGPQTLCAVAIGINGVGTISGVSTSNAYVFGTGTDFANLATGAALQAAVANINGATDYVNIGFVSATHGAVSVAVANTQNTGNIIGTTGNAQTLTVNQPVTFDASLGGLSTSTVYYVKAIANASAFTVSLTRGGSEVDLSSATGTPNALQERLILNANSPITFTDVPFVYANDEAGYIVRQKGKTKYLVKGATTGLTAQCYTSNVANSALTANTMSIIATNAAPGTQYVSSLNDYQSQVFATTVAAGSLVGGTQYTIYSSGNTNWTAVGAASNMTGVTFTATGAGSGTGTAIAIGANPDIIATFGTAYAANTYGGQPNPIVTISNA